MNITNMKTFTGAASIAIVSSLLAIGVQIYFTKPVQIVITQKEQTQKPVVVSSVNSTEEEQVIILPESVDFVLLEEDRYVKPRNIKVRPKKYDRDFKRDILCYNIHCAGPI